MYEAISLTAALGSVTGHRSAPLTRQLLEFPTDEAVSFLRPVIDLSMVCDIQTAQRYVLVAVTVGMNQIVAFFGVLEDDRIYNCLSHRYPST